MKKILITGGSGFIGYHFHQMLPQNSIVNLDLVEPTFEYDSIYCQGDIRNPEDVERVLSKYDCDIIINLAAEHKDFGITRAEYFHTNEGGTKILTEKAAEHSISKFIFYSSVAVYGENREPSFEKMKPQPNNDYGDSKLAAEKVLYDWAEKDPTRGILIIRPTVVYGERNLANMYRLIKQINSGMYFNIGSATNVKSIAYVKNLVEATLYLKEKIKPGVDIYNYADNPHISAREIGVIISKGLKRKSPITLPYGLVYMMGLPFDLLIKLTRKDLPISTHRIKKLCTQTYHKAEKVNEAGFKPKYNNVEGIQAMVNWFQIQNNLN